MKNTSSYKRSNPFVDPVDFVLSLGYSSFSRWYNFAVIAKRTPLLPAVTFTPGNRLRQHFVI